MKKILIAVFLFIAVALYCWGWLFNPANKILRYQTTGLNSHFITPTPKNFHDYVIETKNRITQARTQANVDHTAAIINDNAPKELLADASCKTTRGAILIHGLFDSPYSLHELEKFLHDKCFTVYTVLLPGNGTVPGDLLETSYQDWTQTVEFAMQQMSKHVNQFYLVGYSLGGLIAAHEAIQNPEHIKGLVLFAPAIKLKTKLTPFIPLIDWISRVVPRMQWWTYHDDTNPVGYQSVNVNPVYQTYELIKLVQTELMSHTIDIPMLVVQSAEDETVDAEGTRAFFAANARAKDKLIWLSEIDHDAAYGNIDVMHSAIDTRRILSQSHISLILRDNDPIYGVNGIVKDCLHYAKDSAPWMQCKSGKDIYFGEITNANLQRGVVRRITFDPFIDSVLEQIAKFLL